MRPAGVYVSQRRPEAEPCQVPVLGVRSVSGSGGKESRRTASGLAGRDPGVQNNVSGED
jgi:hypothetical protein